MHSWSKKRERVVRLVGYVVLTFVLIGYAFSATGRHSNVVALDSLRTKEVPSNVAVIAIDDATLSALGAWPLDRSVYARLITELNGYNINGLVFDVLFLEEKADDEAVRDALSGSQYPVVLGIKRGETDFLHAVFNGEASVTEGFVNVSPDKDGKVRSFVSPERHSGGCVWPLSLAILVPTLENDVCPTINGTRFLYSREVPTFSLVDVIEGKVPKDVLKGKVLFVGATTLDLEDYFVGLEGVKIPGVFVHTAMYSSYTNNLLTKSLGATVELLAIIMFVIIGSSFVRYIKKPTKQIFFVGFVIVLLLVVTVVAFDFSYEVPLVSLVLSFLASFVLSTLHLI
jgi:CHASE2 domain-containing sensor protein